MLPLLKPVVHEPIVQFSATGTVTVFLQIHPVDNVFVSTHKFHTYVHNKNNAAQA